jgi:hypothetical protein
MKQLSGKPFALSAFAILILLLFQTVLSSGGELYKWRDDEGTLHMTDNLANVPPQYREQAEKRTTQTMAEPDYQPEVRQNDNTESSVQTGLHLNSFEVPYKAFEGSARRIIISVTFNETVTADMLLDTGSPGLLITPKLADRLGLIKEDDGNLVVTAGGIGGSVPAMLAVVDVLRVGDARAEFSPAIITEVSSSDYEGLVGMDFLANYKISIHSDKEVLVFDELPPQIDRPGGHDEAWWRSNFQNFSKLKTEWSDVLSHLENANMTSSEKERLVRIVKAQHSEAEKICRKLERYARDSVVPSNWRH